MKNIILTLCVLLTANCGVAKLSIRIAALDSAFQINGSGSLDLTDAVLVDSSVWYDLTYDSYYDPSAGFLASSNGFLDADLMDVYQVEGEADFWESITFAQGTATGDDFFLYHSDAISLVGVPAGYESTSDLSWGIQIDRAGDDSAGLLDLSGVAGLLSSSHPHITSILDASFALPKDNIFMTSAAVPEPSTYALFAGFLTMGVAGSLRRRNSKTSEC
ncbi:PEP-CTERM sorting domain-containing protein [Cerasicoccus frondis]|uniref:PEP-CTERM sorting domain-containing protein n=1 Tax=Cerasicoccus frondis TaxID=490090 RepID=UPI002852B8BC|nr:PEP-CTERM sorting domain-containing protein [Cerasicoccus frondis]